MKDEEFSVEDIIEGTLNNLGNMEVTDPETAVIWAVDTTLRYVVEWLSDTGYRAKAEILEQLGDL